MEVEPRNPVGVLFWIVGIVALFWNAMGCINLAQQLSPEGYATLPPEYLSFLEVRPTWALIGFAVSVIAGVIGAVLFLLRQRISFHAFVASGLGALVATLPALGTGITSLIVGSAMSVVLAAAFAWVSAQKLGHRG